METTFNQMKIKKTRGETIAENWKKKELKHVFELRDEMEENNIDGKLIKKYLDEQYEKINKQYENKIKKYQDTQLKKQNKTEDKETKNKRKKAIDFLLKNKDYLEEKGYNPEYIKKFMDKQYEEINKFYSVDTENKIDNIDLEHVNFID